LAGTGLNMINLRPNNSVSVNGGDRLYASGLQSPTMDDIKALQTKAQNLQGVSPSVSTCGQVVIGNKNWPTTIISLVGGVVGVVSAKAVTAFLHWPTLVTASSILLWFGVCTFTGVFFGYYPAQKASRLDPIEALRYE